MNLIFPMKSLDSLNRSKNFITYRIYIFIEMEIYYYLTDSFIDLKKKLKLIYENKIKFFFSFKFQIIIIRLNFIFEKIILMAS